MSRIISVKRMIASRNALSQYRPIVRAVPVVRRTSASNANQPKKNPSANIMEKSHA